MKRAWMLTLLLPLTPAIGEAATSHRLYNGLTAFVANPDGKDFTLTLDVRDINIFENGPREVLFKVYDPEGRAVVREVIADDGVTSKAYQPAAAAWDHEAWYYAYCQQQGAPPMIRWGAYSAPDRLAAVPKRTFTRSIKGGKKGTYRILLVGAIDHYLDLKLDPALPYGVAGNTEWLHGRGEMYRKSFLYVPKGTRGLHLALCEYDLPRTRRITLKTAGGQLLQELAAPGSFARAGVKFEKLGEHDDQVLVLEVEPGPGDFLLGATILRDPAEGKFRGDPAVAAVLAPDEATARALCGGAIYHDGQVFWQPFQVRFHEWLKQRKPEDFIIMGADGKPIDLTKLPAQPGFIPLNGPHWRPPLSDTIMHYYLTHKSPQAINVALRDMAAGLRHIGPGDHIANGPFRNMGYEFSTYAFHFYRPAWRILQQSEAPKEAKDIVQEAFLVCGDRLAFCRGWARINGNAFAHVPMALRYCSAATDDPLQKQLADVYLDRFLTGGWGERVGAGPSGPVQEGFAYAYHYASYILTSWKSVLTDLPEDRFQKTHDRIRTWFSYTLAEEGIAAGAWSARTHYYPQWTIERDGPFAWKGLPGPDFTVSVNDANEWFAARRKQYYVLTYHGRLCPKWIGVSHAGQSGYGGGMLCQLHVPGKGPVIASTLNGNYGEGMHPSQWRTFHLHSVVGQTTDGRPLVSADSEHDNARLKDGVVTSSGEVRDTAVQVLRSYTFGADDVACEVQLKETGQESLLSLWVKSPLRGKVAEAYEMIPFVANRAGKRTKKPEDQTLVKLLDADGKELGVLSKEEVAAKTVVIDRGGFGVRIELDEPRKVLRGEASTLLIRLASQPVPASTVALKYRIVPFGAP
jgi:hypothetical protein